MTSRRTLLLAVIGVLALPVGRLNAQPPPPGFPARAYPAGPLPPYHRPPMPPPRYEPRPPRPVGRYRWYWTPGHWRWTGRGWAWVPGRWRY